MFAASKALVRALAASDTMEYLSCLSQLKNCVVIAALCDTAGYCCNDALDEAWKKLGFSASLKAGQWRGYVGVLENGKCIFENMAELDGVVYWEMDRNNEHFTAESQPYWRKNKVSICINGEEQAQGGRGVNIIIYDLKKRQCVDSISFDTCRPDFMMHRKNLPFTAKVRKEIGFERIRCKLRKMFPEPIKEAAPLPAAPNAQNRQKRAKEYRNLFLNSGLFPKVYLQSNTPKIKVRVIFEEESHNWNCIKTLLQAFKKDERFQVCVIMMDSRFEKPSQKAAEIGIDCVKISQYNFEQDAADIMIIMPANGLIPQKRALYKAWGQYAKLYIASVFTLVGAYCEDFSTRIGPMAPRLRHMGADYILYDSLIYKKLQRDGYDMTGCVEMGNPKFDGIFSKLGRPHPTPNGWEKIQGKKVFLWAFDHDCMQDSSTVEQYAKTVFSYFTTHENVALIFRPHPYWKGEVIANKLISAKELDEAMTFMNSTENMVWDEDPDYSIAYDMADAIITDVECGITVSALATKKPLCVFFRMGVERHISFPELIDNLYQVQSEQEAIDFFEMIQRGEDPMREQRERAFHECILHFDGKNGQRMKDFIVEKYFEKCGVPEGMDGSVTPAAQE